MRFLLTPTGSHGDVHPYVGIGRRLRERGHEVVVFASGNFRELVETSGLEFVETLTAGEYRDLTENPDLWHPRKGLGLVIGTVAENLERGYETFDAYYQEGDVFVLHFMAAGARVFVEKHRAAAATIQLAPVGIRSVHQVPPLAPGLDISGWPTPLKRAFWWFGDRYMVDPHLVPSLNALLQRLDLPPVRRPFAGWLNAPGGIIALFPEWFGGSPPDWPDNLEQVGFPLYDEADLHAPDPELEAFLERYAADGGPIALTPGSANRHGREFFEAGIAAAAQLGRGALCLTGFPETLPDTLPDHAFHARYVPFSQVFPRCCAVAHHGGIGTLGQTLAAGVPHLVRPLGFDQPDNAARLERLGVGDWLIPPKFTSHAVAEKLNTLLGSELVAANCDRYREALDGVDAVGRSCEILERIGDT